MVYFTARVNLVNGSKLREWAICETYFPFLEFLLFQSGFKYPRNKIGVMSLT